MAHLNFISVVGKWHQLLDACIAQQKLAYPLWKRHDHSSEYPPLVANLHIHAAGLLIPISYVCIPIQFFEPPAILILLLFQPLILFPKRHHGIIIFSQNIVYINLCC